MERRREDGKRSRSGLSRAYRGRRWSALAKERAGRGPRSSYRVWSGLEITIMYTSDDAPLDVTRASSRLVRVALALGAV